MVTEEQWEEWKSDPDFDKPKEIASRTLKEHGINLEPEISISRTRSDGSPWKRRYTINVRFPEKGNKPLIQTLREWGWDVTIRRKERTDGLFTKNQYAGYAMMTHLRLIVKEIVEEE